MREMNAGNERQRTSSMLDSKDNVLHKPILLKMEKEIKKPTSSPTYDSKKGKEMLRRGKRRRNWIKRCKIEEKRCPSQGIIDFFLL